MTEIRAVISDFGGVLTSPLLHSFAAFQDSSGIPLEALGRAMAAVGARDGMNPLFRLERGEMTEREFLQSLGDAISEDLGRPVQMHGFA
ncbi:MAG TPA: HAD family phosphatase, partial [Solirubrobacteraceae bacterium]|nr:HAD family phosphatase [Solirubrobacteraceae bacterium]